MTLTEIEKIVETPLRNFRHTYQLTLASEIAVIHNIGNKLIDGRGKQLRPLLMMLCTGASGASFDGVEQLAVAIELLHNSTLLHDDVVDQSNLRRGTPSVSSLYGNKTAVLCGDYFLAKVMLLLNEYNDQEVNRVLDRTVMDMSTGEILQQHRSSKLDGDMEHYRDTIYRKTASLISACTELGAMNTPWRGMMKEYGQHLGMAFQLRDDLLDYQPATLTGKPTGNDIKEHKLTLPIILYLQEATPAQRDHIFAILDNGTISDEETQALVSTVNASPAIEACRHTIAHELQQAAAAISALPPSPYKEGLLAVLQFLSQN